MISSRRFIPAIIFFAITVVLMCLPGSAIPKYKWLALIHADKIVHISMFGLLCWLFSRPFHQTTLTDRKRKNWFLFITIAGICYGTMMEFVQKYWIPNRSFELKDIAADSVGCVLSYFYSLRKFLGRV